MSSSLQTQTAIDVLTINENMGSASGSSLDRESFARYGPEESSASMFDVLNHADTSASSLRRRIKRLSQNSLVVGGFAVITLWVLFADDLRLACMPITADEPIAIISIVCMIAFAFEIVMYTVSIENYMLSFFFWLDIVATLSMVLDIPAVHNTILASVGGSDSLESAEVARATRMSRIGTKVMRVVRMVRLIKLVKVWSGQRVASEAGRRSRISRFKSVVKQSHVGQKLLELTTRRVVLGVLIMVLVLPFLDIANTLYGTAPRFSEAGLRTLHSLALQDAKSALFARSLQDYQDSLEFKLGSRRTGYALFLQVANVTYVPAAPQLGSLRVQELRAVVERTSECDDGMPDLCFQSTCLLDLKWASQMESLLLVGKTAFILIVLGGGALVFSADANRIVLIPIDRMVQRVKNMADNPRTNIIEEEPQQPPVETMPLEAADTEMRILEASIDKLAELLGVAFGDAGVDIVSANMKCIGKLNPMVPGHRTVAIFGFCDIRNFTDITEILQEGVMSFVNTIAEIVHCEVHDHAGAANKNIGDAFLLVWKFREGFTGKHLKALLKATRECAEGRSFDDFGHVRHSDMSRCPVPSRLHSVASVSSFDAKLARSSCKNGDCDADQPTLAGAASNVAAKLTVNQPGPGRRLDRSQLSLMLHGAWPAPVVATSKGSVCDMQWPEPLCIGGADDDGDLPSVLPQNLPLRDVPAATLRGYWSPPDGVEQAHRGTWLAGASSAHSQDAGDSVMLHSDAAIATCSVHGELARMSIGGSAQQDLVRLLSAPSIAARSTVSQVAAHARTPQAADPSDDAPAWPSSQPVAEGKELQAGSGESVPEAARSPFTNSSGVRVRMQPRGPIRRKSSNYARLLDNYKRLLVRAQCVWTGVSDRLPQTDALNILQECREEHVGSISPLIDARPATPPAAAFQPGAARQQKFAEVMCGPPEKLCGHAEHAQSLADNALNSFIIINAALQRSSALAMYTRRHDVQKRMGKGYRVGMGFGLHTGWSVEGAIGSRYKVDASYLSPNVNMAARLESATKQYGVDILMSADFSALLSPRMRARCRQIDTVLVKGSAEPMGIWTIDTDTRFVVSDGLEVHAGNHAFVHSSRTDFAWVEAGLDEFEGHTDVQLSYAANSDFLLVWQTAFDFYKAGDWLKARSHFEQTYTMRRDRQGCIVRDMPSKVLMDFMALTHFVAPGDWDGSRALTEK